MSNCSFKIGELEIPVKDIFIYPETGIQLTRTGFVNVVNMFKLTTMWFQRENDKYPFGAEAQISGQRIYTISHELMAVQDK